MKYKVTIIGGVLNEVIEAPSPVDAAERFVKNKGIPPAEWLFVDGVDNQHHEQVQAAEFYPKRNAISAPVPGAEGANPGSSTSSSGALERYRDAYLVASAATSLGSVIKGVALLFGLLVIATSLVLGIAHVQLLFLGLFLAISGSIPIFVSGVLISAQGQTLRASLDGAVHTSPFLTKEEMKRVMAI
jgi:hypothetical protein